MTSNGSKSGKREVEYAIFCPEEGAESSYRRAGLWVKGSVGSDGHRLVVGLRKERKAYPTREAAQAELDRTCSPGEFVIVEVGA